MAENKKSQKNPRGKSNSSRSKGGKFSKRQRAVESADMAADPKLKIEQRGDANNCHVGAPNDWRWYAQNPQLIRDYASYPFGNPVGNLLNTGIASLDSESIPGVMAFRFVPTIGWADNENSPINVAMRKLYSFVRHANSGASNYDAPDLMMYMIAVDSALMFHSELKRVYGVFQDYTPFNRYYPRALITAMGYNYADLELHLNDLRGFINLYAAKLSQLWIPNSMSYMARHVWMAEAVYTDSNTEKAQTYLYTPWSFWQFSLDTDGAGQLSLVQKPSQQVTFEQLVTLGNSLLNAMIPNEDFGIMSGDILKAFGPSGIVQVSGITEDYKILPVYNQEVLSQMENATIISTPTTGWKITQKTTVGTGYLVSEPQANLTLAVGTPPSSQNARMTLAQGITAPLVNARFLNFHHSAPSPEEVMVATRLMHIPNYAPGQTWAAVGSNQTCVLDLVNIGSEVIIGARMYAYGIRTSSTVPEPTVLLVSDSFQTIASTGLTGTIDQQMTQAQGLIMSISRLSQFDWHPAVFFNLVANDAGSGESSWTKPTLPLMDLDFYTMLDATNLKNMTTAALLSEFSIPQI